MYVCIHVCMYLGMCACMHNKAGAVVLNPALRICVSMCECMPVCMYAYKGWFGSPESGNACMYACIICMYTYIRTCIYAHAYISMHMCSTDLKMHILRIYIYTYAHTYMHIHKQIHIHTYVHVLCTAL